MDALLTLLLLDGPPAREPHLPEVQRFPVCDRVLLRSGPATLFFEGGPQVGDHTHPDKGQFILEAYGERLAADPGMCDYSDPAHLSFKSTYRHNLVTVGGKDQSYRDALHAVVIRRLDSSDPSATLIDADLSGAYKELSSYDRRILFVRAALPYVVVVDEVECVAGAGDGAAAELAWNFHARGGIEAVAAAPGGSAATGAAIRRYRVSAERAGMHLLVGSPQPLEPVFATTEAASGVFTRDLSLRTSGAQASLRIAALLAPFPLATEAALTVEAAADRDGIRFMVSGPWGRDVVVCRFGDAPRLERG
jgi:hypothetical protein